MKKFKNQNNVSVTSRVWVSPTGTRIAWRAATTPFNTFVAQVADYCQKNNLEVPTADQLEDLMCQQSPSRDCTDDPNYHIPEQRRISHEVVSGGCKACGS